MAPPTANLISLLRSTLVGLDDDASTKADELAVSELKRSVVCAVADLELRKLETERFEHAAEVASLLARAGRAAYVVHPAVAERTVTEPAALAASDAEPSAETDSLSR